jgi:hypothetical protein
VREEDAVTTQPRLSAEPQPAADLVRSVHVIGRDEEDPAEPWEQPASSDELTELSTRRFERLPHRPANLGEVPEGALDDLRPVLGDLRLDQLFIIPRTTRMVGATAGAHWVVTPTEVLAVGSDRLAVWINDDDGPRIRATIPFSEVVAVSDRTILLYSRLELVGRDASVVVRYNTVGRPEIRSLIEPVRAVATPVAASTAPGTGADPDSLPHKWMALTRSGDVQPVGTVTMVVAPGELDSPKPILHSGMTVLTDRELIVATDPTPDVRMAQYGFDLLIVARERLLGLAGNDASLRVIVDAGPGRLELETSAHPSVVDAAVRVLGPIVGTR